MIKNPIGSLLLFLTLMISIMAAYINLGNMLYGDPLHLINRMASVLFLLSWVVLSIYSIKNGGDYSFLLRAFWFPAVAGAVLCIVTISGVTRMLEYGAYFLLFLLTPLFGLRFPGMTHLAWAVAMAGIALLFLIVATIATRQRKAYAPAPEPIPAPAQSPEPLAGTVSAEPTLEPPSPKLEPLAEAPKAAALPDHWAMKEDTEERHAENWRP